MNLGAIAKGQKQPANIELGKIMKFKSCSPSNTFFEKAPTRIAKEVISKISKNNVTYNTVEGIKSSILNNLKSKYIILNCIQKFFSLFQKLLLLLKIQKK